MDQTSRQTGRPVTMAPRGMVAAPHYLASQAGVWAMQQGGNAVDAAIAANLVLSVVYPHRAGLGGDAFFMIWQSGRHEPICLNGSGASAYNATLQFYRDRGHEVMPQRGPLAANTVPGAVAAWGDVHSRWGSLAWEQLFEPALHYAESGFPVTANLARALERARQILERNDEAREIFFHDGRPYQVGEILIQKDLARTLETLAADGCQVFYSGEVADEIVSFLQRHGGLLTAQDLQDHHSDWVDPLRTTYRGRSLYELPPSTQGLAALLIFNVLEGFDIQAMGDDSARYYHTMVEAAKAALADLDRWIADPNFVALPLEQLLSREYAAGRRALIPPDRARPLRDYASGILRQEQPQSAALPGSTAYIAAADAGGLAVSLIQSLHADFGAGVVAGETGVLLQNAGSAFKLEAADPNRLEPHKRPFQALIPAMMFESGRPWLIFGTSGGDGQPQIQAALLSRVVDLGYNIQQAIEAPRWLYEPIAGEDGERVRIEGWMADAVLRELRAMGYNLKVIDGWSDVMGQAQGILVDQEHGVFHGGADPRGDGLALGW